MFSVLRNRLGIPGLISVIALVFAMGGGAYAANDDSAGASANNRKGGGNVNKLIKREARKFSKVFSQRFSKRFPGPIGPQGVPGLPGAPGSDGDDGDDGDDGSDGKEGKEGPAGDSVTSISFEGPDETPPNEGPCEGAGGTEFEIEGSGSPEYVCNGSDGEGDVSLPATLPEDATLTGVYGVDREDTKGLAEGRGTMDEGDAATVEASFSIPLDSAPAFVFVPSPNPGGGGGFGSDAGAGCPGVVDDVPQADSGTLCVYGYGVDLGGTIVPSADVTQLSPVEPGVGDALSPAGTLLEVSCDSAPLEVCYGKGLWAVTGTG